jgi:hypothetical protein
MQSSLFIRTNLDVEKLLIKQIFSFDLLSSNFDDFRELIIIEQANISISVDGTNIKKTNFKLDDSYLDDKVTIRVDHDLAKLNYDLLFKCEEEVQAFFQSCVTTLTMKELKKIQNIISINLNGEILRCKLNTNLSVFINESKYFGKSALLIPNAVPQKYYKKFSRKILLAFLDVISEKTLSSDEFLIRMGSVKIMEVPSDLELSLDQIENIYMIIKFVFGDDRRYEDKLRILRKVLTDYNLVESDVKQTSWNKLFQNLKDHYSLFIDETIDRFLNVKQKLFEQQNSLSNNVIKEIEVKIEEISRQTLTILATVISSFALKINDKQRFFFLGLAILYTLVMILLNWVKGFSFSSKILIEKKNEIKNGYVTMLEVEAAQKIETSSKPLIEKLKRIEVFQIIFLGGTVLILVSICAIMLYLQYNNSTP